MATPKAFAFDLYVRVPLGATAGCVEKSWLLSLVTMKSSVWPESPCPGEMSVAQPLTVCAAASSLIVWSAPLVKDGGLLTALMVPLVAEAEKLTKTSVTSASARMSVSVRDISSSLRDVRSRVQVRRSTDRPYGS